MSGRWGWGAGGVLALLLLIGPLFVGDYGLTLGFTLCIYESLAQAWNLIGGYGGQFSLGHGMFVGSGAYTVGVLLVHNRLPPAVAVVLGGLTAARSTTPTWPSKQPWAAQPPPTTPP